MALEGAGDGSGHRRRFAEVDLGLTGVKTVRIGENFGVFRRGFPNSIDLPIRQIESQFLVSFFWVLFPSFRIVFLFHLIAISSPFSLRFRPIWREIAEIRDIGDPGPAGSRAAGLPESNLF
ncbi:hypothetical protein CRG98_004553 [Punica granatum]|uniref:Uncharacterized protein n=1 Tax=Punica granatum TaxID=22663 RepID=A0A2I0L2Z2_PUNGR|nr:hypothetical protein CRG98_004553 [Punica granatum]